MIKAIVVQGQEREFGWGPVVVVHEIGEYSIVESHPQIMERCIGTGKYEPEKVSFHPYINGTDISRSFATLDYAIMGAIFYKVDGPNTRLDMYMQILLDAIRKGE